MPVHGIWPVNGNGMAKKFAWAKRACNLKLASTLHQVAFPDTLSDYETSKAMVGGAFAGTDPVESVPLRAMPFADARTTGKPPRPWGHVAALAVDYVGKREW